MLWRIAIYTDLEHKEGIAKILGFLGILHKKQGELDAALVRFGEALALSEAMADDLTSAVWRLNLAIIYLDQGSGRRPVNLCRWR